MKKFIQTDASIRRFMLKHFEQAIPGLRELKNFPFLCISDEDDTPTWIWFIRDNLYILYSDNQLSLKTEMIANHISCFEEGRFPMPMPVDYEIYYASYIDSTEIKVYGTILVFNINDIEPAERMREEGYVIEAIEEENIQKASFC